MCLRNLARFESFLERILGDIYVKSLWWRLQSVLNENLKMKLDLEEADGTL